MAEKLEDLNLPNSSVLKIIKEAVSDSVNISKDARSALSKAASIFVLYVTSQASKEAQKAKRKTLLGVDIIGALEEIEFDEFIEPLQEFMTEYKAKKKASKMKKSMEVVNETGEAEEEEAMEEDETGE